MTLFSRGCQYGIQALLHLYSQPPDEYISVGEIARLRKISPSFLSKITGRLVAHGLLESVKGPGGGVRLALSVHDITLLDVVEATDGLGFLEGCVLGFPKCSDSAPCPVHHLWEPLRENIASMLSSKSLHDLALDRGNSRRKPKKKSLKKNR